MDDYAFATEDDFDALTDRLRNLAVDQLEQSVPNNISLTELLMEACAAIDELKFRLHCNEFGFV